MNIKFLCVSIDDFYKTFSDRQELQKNDMRIKFRGPPGTHDIEILNKLYIFF